MCETSRGLQKFTANIGHWLGWPNPAGTVENGRKSPLLRFTAGNLVDKQRDAPMRGSNITRAVILGMTHRPLPFAAWLVTGSPSIGTPTLAVS
jgi:hypothetical protein